MKVSPLLTRGLVPVAFIIRPKSPKILFMNNNELETENTGIKKNISGLGQQIIGEIELIGGVLTGDPITQAEGEFNLEVGEIRDEIEETMSEDSEGS